MCIQYQRLCILLHCILARFGLPYTKSLVRDSKNLKGNAEEDGEYRLLTLCIHRLTLLTGSKCNSTNKTSIIKIRNFQLK